MATTDDLAPRPDEVAVLAGLDEATNHPAHAYVSSPSAITVIDLACP